MSRRRMQVALAAGALTLSLAIAGCGQQATTTSTTETAVEQKDPAEKFVGEWKLAYVEAEGITIGGDLKGLEELTGESLDMGLNLTADGKGEMTFAGESASFAWELKDDNTATIAVIEEAGADGEAEGEATAEAPDLEDAKLIYRDGEIGIEITAEADDTSSIEGAISTGTLFFTADGKSDKANVPDLSAATDISSADALVGDWKLAGFGMGGLVVACDPNSEILTGTFGDTMGTASFKDDGTCVLFDSETNWEVKDGVASLSIEGTSMEVKQAGDYLVIDLGSALDASGSMSMLYVK